jgi:hypothetical protein
MWHWTAWKSGHSWPRYEVNCDEAGFSPASTHPRRTLRWADLQSLSQPTYTRMRAVRSENRHRQDRGARKAAGVYLHLFSHFATRPLLFTRRRPGRQLEHLNFQEITFLAGLLVKGKSISEFLRKPTLQLGSMRLISSSMNFIENITNISLMKFKGELRTV